MIQGESARGLGEMTPGPRPRLADRFPSRGAHLVRGSIHRREGLNSP